MKFKLCPVCGEKNDATEMECRNCDSSLVTVRVSEEDLEQTSSNVFIPGKSRLMKAYKGEE